MNRCCAFWISFCSPTLKGGSYLVVEKKNMNELEVALLVLMKKKPKSENRKSFFGAESPEWRDGRTERQRDKWMNLLIKRKNV